MIRGLVARRRLLVALLLAVALLLRVGYVASQSNYTPFADAADYDRHAVSLALHGHYPPSAIAPSGGPTAFRPPAYPYLLAGAYAATGTAKHTSRYTVARVLSAVLGTMTVAVVGVIAWLLWSLGAALVAMALAAVYPPLVTIGDSMLSEPLFTLLVLAAVAAAVAGRRSPGRLRWPVAAGVLVGLAALSRTNGIVVLPVIAAGLWPRPLLARASLARVGALALAAVLVIVPWAIRNTLEFHQFVPLSTQAGFTLAGTYNDVSRNDPRSPAAWRVPTMAPYGALLRPGPNEATLERRFRSRALDYATSRPGYIAKVAYWNLGRMTGLQGASTERPAARESGIGDHVSDLDVYSFYVLALLALAAVAAGALRGTPAFVWAVPLAIAVSLVLVIVYMRYRIPIDPFLLMLVGGGAARMYSSRRERLQDGAVLGRPRA